MLEIYVSEYPDCKSNELYSLGWENINTWIRNYFPTMKDTIFWCQDSPGVTQHLLLFDPELIWDSYGFNAVYMTNCHYSNPPLEGVPIDQV